MTIKAETRITEQVNRIYEMGFVLMVRKEGNKHNRYLQRNGEVSGPYPNLTDTFHAALELDAIRKHHSGNE